MKAKAKAKSKRQSKVVLEEHSWINQQGGCEGFIDNADILRVLIDLKDTVIRTSDTYCNRMLQCMRVVEGLNKSIQLEGERTKAQFEILAKSIDVLNRMRGVQEKLSRFEDVNKGINLVVK